MLRITFVVFCIAIASAHQVLGQDSVSTRLGLLDDEFGLLGKAVFDKNQWSLAIEYQKDEYRTRTNSEVNADIDRWLDATDLRSRPEHVRTERQVLLQRRKSVKRLFLDWTLAGRELARFVYSPGLDVPARFATKDGQLSLIVTGLASENVYNTIQLSSRQRASSILQSMILPSLRYFTSAKLDSNVMRYGMCVLYGSKNFVDRSALNLQPEMLAFIAPADLCRKFVAGEVTEDDLVGAADIYLSDRDSSTDVKKVKLVLE
jgi:hypothetical protein